MSDDDILFEHDGEPGADFTGASADVRRSAPSEGSSSPKAEGHKAASAFSDALEGEQHDVKNPFEVTDVGKWTPTQKEQWRYMRRAEKRYFSDLREHERGGREGKDVRKPLLADLGGIGSGKSYTGAGLIAPLMVQRYDGSIGLFCANTREQAEQTLIPRFKEGLAALGFSWERATYHKSITFRGTVYKHTIRFELDGGGYSFIRVGSFESADRLESEEFDWGILSEIQSADELAFKKVRRRIRTMYANALVYAEGTPKKEQHWQYDALPEMAFRVWMSDTRDNPHKQPGYAADLRRMYDAARADAMVAGHPIKETTDAVFYTFDREVHVESQAAEELTDYDPGAPLLIFIDFNLAPMSIGVFQPKDGSGYDGFADTVLAQIDEYEVWDRGTREACREVRADYSDHLGGGLISGDGSERKDTKSPDQTDWDIVRRELGREMPGMRVQPGTHKPDGSDTWQNPRVKDRINAGNWLLKDGQGRARCVFLPDSDLRSGGVSASVSGVEKDEEGKINKSIDKTDDRGAVQSHFADVWSYMAYDHYRKTGHAGSNRPAEEALDALETLNEPETGSFSSPMRRGSFTDI